MSENINKKQPLVLIPGFMLDASMWDDLAPLLSDHYRLLHADPTNPNSIAEYAAMTLSSAPPKFVLVGFSMGGYVAREMVRMSSDRVSGMILIATSAREGKRTATPSSDCPNIKSPRFNGLSRAAIRKSLGPEREDDDALVERLRVAGVRLGGDTYLRQSAFLRESDLDRLNEISCPTLVIAGKHDKLRSFDEAQELGSGIPNAELQVLEAGHMVPLEVPGPLARAILEFASNTRLGPRREGSIRFEVG